MGVIEIMIGFMMVSLLLTGLVVTGLYAIRSAKYAQERSIATKISSQQLERFRVKRDSEGFTALTTPSTCNPCHISNSLAYDSIPHAEGIYNISSNVVVDNATCPPGTGNAYKISTTVTWGTTPLHTVNNEICLSDWR